MSLFTLKPILIVGVQNWSFAVDTRKNDLEALRGINEIDDSFTFEYLSFLPDNLSNEETQFDNEIIYPFVEEYFNTAPDRYNLSKCKSFWEQFDEFIDDELYNSYNSIICLNPLTPDSQDMDKISYEKYLLSLESDKPVMDVLDNMSLVRQAMFYHLCNFFNDSKVIRIVHDPKEIGMMYIPNIQYFCGDQKHFDTITHKCDDYGERTHPYYYLPLYHKFLFDNEKVRAYKKFTVGFGCTNMAINSDNYRQQVIDNLTDLEPSINKHDKKVVFYFRTRYHQDDKLDYKSYLKLLERSKFTFIIPAYDDKAFSYRRFFEAITKRCIPIIDKSIDIETVFKHYPDLINFYTKYKHLLICDISSPMTLFLCAEVSELDQLYKRLSRKMHIYASDYYQSLETDRVNNYNDTKQAFLEILYKPNI